MIFIAKFIATSPRSAVASIATGIALILLAQAGFAQSVAVTHCEGECPRYTTQLAANQSNVVIHHLYAAGINGNTSLPDWVAYRLTAEAIGVASLIPRTWQSDRLVRFSPLEDVITLGEAELNLAETISQSNNPYAGGAADLVEPDNRARLAPMTGFANTPYWADLNNFSNMVPMPATLRLGPWLRLEQRLNHIAAADGQLNIITGPLYLINNLSLNPSSEDLNPAAYFKLVTDDSGTVAFYFPESMAQSDDFCDNTADVSQLEEMTGIDFFPARSTSGNSPSLLAKLGCA